MKIRTDFITNSSSSSFIIMAKEKLTKEQLKEELEKAINFSSGFFSNLGEDIAEVLVKNSNPIGIHEFMSDYTSAENISELKESSMLGHAVYKNYIEYPYIFIGDVSDEGDPLEVFLTDADIDFKNDKIVVVKSGGY